MGVYDGTDEPELLFDPDQMKTIRWTPAIPALFSAVGSILIIQRIVRSKKRLLAKTYERLMLGLSLVDAFTSIHLMIVPYFYRPFTAPSTVCTIHGFLLTLGFAGPMYNAALASYFVLIIVYNVPNHRISRYYEPWLHTVAVGYGAVCAVSGLPLQVYNPEKDGLACWAAEWPHGCGDSCQRGASAATFAAAVGLLPLVGILILLIVSNVVIYCTVRRIIARTEGYTNPTGLAASATRNSSVSLANHSLADDRERPPSEMTSTSEFHASPTSHTARLSSSKTKAVAVQSILYVLAYLLCFVWSLVLMVLGIVDPMGMAQGDYFFLSVLQMVFYPSQGLFNAFVYIRPIVARLRRQDPDRSRWRCVWSVLLDAD